MIGTRFINSFLEKKFFGGEWGPILGPKIVHPQNSGSIVRNFENFAQ